MIEIGIGMLDLGTTIVGEREPETAPQSAFSSAASGPVLVAAGEPSNLHQSPNTFQPCSIRGLESTFGDSHIDGKPVTPATVEVSIAFCTADTRY